MIAKCSQAEKIVKGINLKVYNNTGQSCTIKIYTQTKPTEGADQTFVTQYSILDNVLTANILIPDVVEAKNYLCIYAELTKGGRSKSEYRLIDKKDKNIQVPIDIPGGKALGGTNFVDIKESMKYEPEKFRINENYSTADLFNGLFGGLIVYKDSANNKVSIKQVISPVELGTRTDTKFGLYSDKKTTVASKEQSATAKLSIPSIAGVSLDYNSADLFKLEIMYKNAGPILWTPTPEMEDIPAKFKKLSASKLLFLGELYNQDTTLQLAPIDNAYVYEAISFDLIKFNRLSINTQVSGGVYFTATGNYASNNEETQKQIFGSFMLGAWWSNDYTPLLKYARKLYLGDKAKQIQEQQTDKDVRDIYNSLRESNQELPDYTTKQKAIEEINKLKQKIKVNENDIKIKQEPVKSIVEEIPQPNGTN